MILQGNTRGGAKNLALHLLKGENEHVSVHELRGFMSDNLISALNETYAVSRGTRAKKFLFSLSLNPPETEKVAIEDFERTIETAEQELNLTGQPRAIVFHEKKGRRHCHVVWSRIDHREMKAIPLSFYKRRLMALSRDLYLKHGWTMPKGFIRRNQRDPNNFTLAQWQQAKRIGKDPKAIKATLRDCWTTSKTQAAFQKSLKQQGYTLAKGSRRAFVVIDQYCEIYSVSRWVGIKTKDVRAKLSDESMLPALETAKAEIAKHMTARLSKLKEQHVAAIDTRLSHVKNQLSLLNKQHKTQRQQLIQKQELRLTYETLGRQKRFNRGLKGFLDIFTGKRRRITQQNEQDTKRAVLRDQREKDALIFEQIAQTKPLRSRAKHLETFSKKKQRSILDDLNQYREIKSGRREVFKYRHQHSPNKPSRER